MMHVSPLLDPVLVEMVAEGLQQGLAPDLVVLPLLPRPLEERAHVLRFLHYCGINGDQLYDRLLRSWRVVLPPTHPLDSRDLRHALWRLGQWWDTNGVAHPMSAEDYDTLEMLLNAAGAAEGGLGYFHWVALHPMLARMDDITDDMRRGAVISLARFGFMRPQGSLETALARHLDDALAIQTSVIDILAALKSRLLARIANWYLANDPYVKPVLAKHF